MLYLLVLLSVLQKEVQTDWMGGDGVTGPVTNWGTQYYQSDSVTTATEGQVSLVATQWDYTSSGWVRHSVENNSGIYSDAQGLMPADIDNNGIQDLVAYTADSVVWYKRMGSNYDNWIKNIIGPAGSEGHNGDCVFPCDVDKNGKIDVLVATYGSGLGWFKNALPSVWAYNQIDNTQHYYRVSATDIDLDGDMDIITVCSGSSSWVGVIKIFKNDGIQNFTLAQTITESGSYGTSWRTYSVDFNKDGYSDIYSANPNIFIYLNDGTSNPGHFTHSFSPTAGVDGAWPVDINMDGNMDLICAGTINSGTIWVFNGLLGDGTGTIFTPQILTGDMYNYGDGAMARDIDLDGLPDIVGTNAKVGWFHQSGTWPSPAFTLYHVDNLGGTSYSHWIYAAPLGNKCTPSIDLLVTQLGEHIVYENKMLKAFANYGELTSSILELDDQNRKLQYFGWDACLPDSSTLAFLWRADTTVSGINGQLWNGPYYATKDIDSVALPQTSCYRYFQYKVEFKPNTTPLDIAVLYEVWVSYDTCIGAAYAEDAEAFNKLNLQVINDKILLSSSTPYNNVALSIYNISGELVQTLYKGNLETRDYVFRPNLQIKGVYLAVFKYGDAIRTAKFVKYK